MKNKINFSDNPVHHNLNFSLINKFISSIIFKKYSSNNNKIPIATISQTNSQILHPPYQLQY